MADAQPAQPAEAPVRPHPSQRPRLPPTQQQSLPRRLLNAYLDRLKRKPLSTKMVTSALLFFAGDSIAQLGIEGRSLPWLRKAEEKEKIEAMSKQEREDASWDPYRAARLIFYGGTIFAPLAHNWLNLLQRVQLSSKFKSECARTSPPSRLTGRTQSS